MARRRNVLKDVEKKYPGFWMSPFVKFFTTVILFWVFVGLGVITDSIIPIPKGRGGIKGLDELAVKVDMTTYTGYQPVVIYEELISPRMVINDTTLEILLRVVEAEVTGEDWTYEGHQLTREEMLEAKIRVAQVFMNRVESDDSNFANIDNLYDALTQKGATSTLIDGRYYTVIVTDLTREAVEIALKGDTPDYTDGALFFCSGTTTCKYGDLLFIDPVGHAFFK